MKVKDTIVAMLKAYPSLYTSRLDALEGMFTSSNAEVINGELIDITQIARDDRFPELPISDFDKTDPFMTLCRLKRRNEEEFIQNNAELIASQRFSSFQHEECKGQRTLSSWTLEHLESGVLNENWTAAAIELTRELWDVGEKYENRKLQDQVLPFLQRNGLTMLPKAQREAEAIELTREIVAELKAEEAAKVSGVDTDK